MFGVHSCPARAGSYGPRPFPWVQCFAGVICPFVHLSICPAVRGRVRSRACVRVVCVRSGPAGFVCVHLCARVHYARARVCACVVRFPGGLKICPFCPFIFVLRAFRPFFDKSPGFHARGEIRPISGPLRVVRFPAVLLLPK